MPKPSCQLNLRLDIPTAERIEHISDGTFLHPSGVGRTLLLERLELEEAGWKLGDKETLKILEAVCRVKEKHREKLKEFLKGLVSEEG